MASIPPSSSKALLWENNKNKAQDQQAIQKYGLQGTVKAMLNTFQTSGHTDHGKMMKNKNLWAILYYLSLGQSA